ncbi:DUF4870 domain-containing protein [Luteolibacter marinus]|uniref:DUF4870 domain-containing protein n=1 Tax=Luteolibacter marinus TaxID=2776705 RepID=UPI0021032E5A|nr:DUF4870 domain-containing protein [Luteolibacter marinus]
MWAMLGHLSALSELLTGGVGNIVGPLIVWQVKKDSMPFATAEAKEALNFNISWLIWGVLLTIVIIGLTFVGIGLLLFPLLWAYPVVWIIFIVIASLRANDGIPYRYPLTARFVT